jgi:hypothetical protein
VYVLFTHEKTTIGDIIMYKVKYRSTYKDELKEATMEASSEISAINMARKQFTDIDYIVSVMPA